MTAVLSFPPVPVIFSARLCVHVSRLAADVGFVRFDLAGQLVDRSHRQSKPDS